ncbi:MAG: hypothetical protein M1823_006364, partial [Watsoniomyces obsoletus]
TYLLIRSNGGDLSSVALDDLLARTGLLDAPLSGQTLYALATLFGVKGHDACDRDLAEQASRTGELKFASEVNEAQRRISSEGLPQTCTHPAALEIIRRVADSNVRGDQAFHSYAHCEHAFPEPIAMPDYTVTPPSSPGQPTFLRGPGLIEIKIPKLPTYGGRTLDPAALANAINAQMRQSPSYAAQFTDPTFRAEGATIWFMGFGQPRLSSAGRTIVNHVGTPAISSYPLNSNGTFKNGSRTHELGVIFDSEILRDGRIDYGVIASILPEEILVHPRLGSHQWTPATVTTAQVLADPVSMVMTAIERESGRPYFVPVNGAIQPAKTWVIPADSLAKYIADNPTVWHANQPAPPPGTTLLNGILVVSNADFNTIKAEAIAQGVRARDAGRPSPYVSSLPIFLTPEQVQIELARLSPPGYAEDIVNVVGSALGGYLFSQNPVTQVIGTSLLQTSVLSCLLEKRKATASLRSLD